MINLCCGVCWLLVVDYLQSRTKDSVVYGFRGGPAGIMKGKYVELTWDFVHPYRNQVRLVDNCRCSLLANDCKYFVLLFGFI